MAIGSLTLTPSFEPSITEYSTTTTNQTNTITVNPMYNDATVVIECNDQVYDSGDSIEWVAGDNEVDITLTRRGDSKTYTVIVSKS